jgi:predicted DNA binding CopG/RHH family protein
MTPAAEATFIALWQQGLDPDNMAQHLGIRRGTPGVLAERGKSVRWNLHLSEGLRERIKAIASARGLQDSRMVEELLRLPLAMVEEER